MAKGNALDPSEAALGKEWNHATADQPHHRRHQPQAGEHALALQALVVLRQAVYG